MGGDRGPSSLQTTFPLQRDTTLRLKMAEKQLNRMIAQTLERRPRNSKVERNVSTQREKAERLEILSSRGPGRGGTQTRRFVSQRAPLCGGEPRAPAAALVALLVVCAPPQQASWPPPFT